ncbi:MAG: PKD domain-containing protein, partial [Patescibacteria group bacterium]
NENTLLRKVIIGGGKKPLAKITLLVNGEEIHDLAKPVKVSKKDKLEFDASDSKNTDGTEKDLEFSWNFRNTKSSSKKKATTNYKELSPKDPGYYKVELKVADKDDPAKFDEDEIYVDVANKAPIFSSVQAIPQALVNDLITPVVVNLKVFEAEDPDGEITRYKWWYFDEDDPDEPLGLQITQGPSAQLTIGTRGKEGIKVTYGFGLEVTDSDGLTYSNEEQIDQGNYSELEVKNGANAQPIAKFTVTPTAVFVGDKLTFTSASTDPDGTIKYYYWDVEGDGFHNNEPSEKPSLEYMYDKKNEEGYEVRLKITDDKGGEATSSPIKVYVDSLAKPPVAAFKYEVMQGSDGMKIKFTNNSTADEEAESAIIGYRWDFDTDSDSTTADSDGDGKKDNDNDSQAKDPERLYSDQGAFNVKLTVTDDQGNSDEVINKLVIPMANPPTAAFTFTVGEGGFITFKNNSIGDKKAGTFIKDYIWDFDTASSLPKADSDGDGNKENDKDSSVKEPSYKYEKAGIYKVKLTVVDNQGNSDEVTNDVNITLGAALPSSSPGLQGGIQGTGSLKAVLITNPLPGSDGIIYLEGASGSVKFDFSKSEGLIANYTIDKNIYFDTNGNGIKDDDEDFKTSLPGTWKTNFEKVWGTTAVKLTVKDLYGNKNSTNIEVKFK